MQHVLAEPSPVAGSSSSPDDKAPAILGALQGWPGRPQPCSGYQGLSEASDFFTPLQSTLPISGGNRTLSPQGALKFENKSRHGLSPKLGGD